MNVVLCIFIALNSYNSEVSVIRLDKRASYVLGWSCWRGWKESAKRECLGGSGSSSAEGTFFHSVQAMQSVLLPMMMPEWERTHNAMGKNSLPLAPQHINEN